MFHKRFFVELIMEFKTISKLSVTFFTGCVITLNEVSKVYTAHVYRNQFIGTGTDSLTAFS